MKHTSWCAPPRRGASPARGAGGTGMGEAPPDLNPGLMLPVKTPPAPRRRDVPASRRFVPGRWFQAVSPRPAFFAVRGPPAGMVADVEMFITTSWCRHRGGPIRGATTGRGAFPFLPARPVRHPHVVAALPRPFSSAAGSPRTPAPSTSGDIAKDDMSASGRHVGEAADILAANSEQACDRFAAGGGWPAARPVWPLGGAY